VPRAGDQFDYAGLRFEVLDMDRHSVDKVLVVPQATRTSNAADADGA
jgi:putative hemolysin